ncbi:MAG: TonB-dependent receptor [Methylococcaceae bacterium]
MQKIIIPTVLFALSGTLHAQEQLPENLPNMVVTATRAGSESKNSLSTAATIYTREDIDRLQVRTLPELLRGSTGVDVVQNGGYGQPSGVFIRGTNSDHILVLIDGIKMGSVTTGTAAFENIPMESVERVEIIRGSQSSLYGSEAIGGVIQIFTRKGSDSEIPKVTLDAGGGSYYTHRSAGSISGKYKNAWYNVGASHLGSEVFSAQTLPANQDKDGYKNTAVNARAGYKFDNNADVEATFMRAQGMNEFDGWSKDSENKKEFVNQVISLSGNMDLMKNWRSTLRLGQTNDEGQNFTPNGQFSSLFESTRWNASWLNQFNVADNHQVIAGTDYRVDEVSSSTLYQQKSRYDVGVFSELHSRFFDDHFVNASVRWDENEAFGNYVTGSVGWRFNWKHGISVLANFGNAFKAPSFNQMYWPRDDWGGGGNPNLKPEESKSYEAGLVGDHNWGQWELRAYHIDVDNLIADWPPVNINKAQIEGIEAEIGTEILGFRPKLTMNLLNPENKLTGKVLPRRSEKTLAFDVSKSFADVDLGAAVIAQGQRFDDVANKTPVGGFVTVDLRSAYHFNKNWMLSAKLNNLLDKNYQTVNTYNMADRNFFVSVHYNN